MKTAAEEEREHPSPVLAPSGVAEVIARLERERVRDPDALEAERYAPEPAERGYWNHPTTRRDDD